MVAISAGGTLAAGSGLLFSPLFHNEPRGTIFGGVALVVAAWCVWQLLTDRLFPAALMAVVAASMAGLGVFTSHSFRLAIAAILVLYAGVGAVIIPETKRFWAFTILVGAAGGFPYVTSHLGWVTMNSGEAAELLIEGIVFWTAAGIFRLIRDEIVTRDQHNRSKDIFLARVAHELRTPLTSVLGFGEVIAEDSSAPEKTRKQGKVIADQARAMAGVIDDFTFVARVDDGLLPLKPATMPATEQIERTLTWIPAPNVRISVTGPSDALVHADPDRLRQLLRVLMTNAVQHAKSSVEVAVNEAASSTVIEIIDDGPGVAAPMDFAEAYRHNYREQGQPEHLGLGLFIAHRLAQAMGVRVSYHRRQGLTVFSVDVPNKPAQDETRSNEGGLEVALSVL